MLLHGLGLMFLLHCSRAQYEGESCVKNGAPGVCTLLDRCQPAIEDLKRRKGPQICGFSGSDSIVCCVGVSPLSQQQRPPPTTTRRPAATTHRTKPQSTTEYVPPVYEYDVPNTSSAGCPPILPNMTAPRTESKAWNKCLEYQEKYVYPCVKGVDLIGDLTRVNRCGHNADELIVGGDDAGRQEFPHMALLGYGDNPSSAQWLCGGSIISEKFILTAGHCTPHREFGDITFAAIGVLRRSDQIDSSKLYRIVDIKKHPQYKSPSKYYDIALLQTEREMELNQFVLPACLQVGDEGNDGRASATGWGTTTNRGSVSDNLQKVILNKFSTTECQNYFGKSRNMERGFDSNTQICYGDKDEKKDTCQGDSGGPLQIKSRRIFCMYVIIGVTSFGKACGFKEPGIYTRVAAFVPWIESVVWP